MRSSVPGCSSPSAEATACRAKATTQSGLDRNAGRPACPTLVTATSWSWRATRHLPSPMTKKLNKPLRSHHRTGLRPAQHSSDAAVQEERATSLKETNPHNTLENQVNFLQCSTQSRLSTRKLISSYATSILNPVAMS